MINGSFIKKDFDQVETDGQSNFVFSIPCKQI
jgi:hypothetical protein